MISYEKWKKKPIFMENNDRKSAVNVANLYWQGLDSPYLQKRKKLWIYYYLIPSKETKSSDIHGIICETTKFASLDTKMCQFVSTWKSGSFSYKPNKISNFKSQIKCFQSVKTGI